MGLEFIDIFEGWAEDYDKSVQGLNPEYKRVFENYEEILNEVVRLSKGTVMEFGVGTGNLTQRLLHAGHSVIGIEPSKAMRDIANKKIPGVSISKGDFLDFPKPDYPVQTIVSTYAFHHLKDSEKEQAIRLYSKLLDPHGRIVFGDTMFITKEAKTAMIQQAHKLGYKNLADDLKREYYTTKDILEELFKKYHFKVSFKQMNDFVWILFAEKQA
ncbi:class I SAM-dependent methyltransferase [Oceanobacillus piezotolerans]|uniref:Uncharacterized methyltransferase D8M04_08870 n=1 Tax=Oceanobacillus piezotolerans TaxID=2448030 RepID=A0A498D697_9BACI|nr:class I SAM-dependent methyltransferase [Oceanobacillus piezotolerans]RLL44976.1 class I SAM-dependent methyltransferase [Oceanobacillus piezotolerans]